MRRIASIFVTSLALASCSSWMGENETAKLEGKRVAVLSAQRLIEPDAAIGAEPVRLPRPDANADWPQAGGYAHHAMHHMVAGDTLRRAWLSNIGDGSTSRTRIFSPPIVAEGRVYAVDASSTVTAVDAKSGKTVWSFDAVPEDEDGEGIGGGIAYDDGRIFAATGFAELIAVKADTGEVVWRQPLTAPVRGAPTVRAGRIFVVTVDNQTHSLAADDGRILWSHSGITETASLLGGTSPAVDGGVVVVAYSSGELFALRVENGTELWSDSVSSGRRTDAVATLTDIRGRPIIDRGRVYAIGHSDMMTAIDLRTGRRVWEREVGSIQNPWIAGDYLFVISNASELAAIDTKTGRVRWVTPLQRWKDEEDQTGRLIWTGPVLVSDRLIISSSHGWSLSISPYTGDVLGKEEMPTGVAIAPIVADGTLYFLTEDADLVAYR